MSAHSIGSATISFGLVSVPVKMFSAGEASAAISFNWLHKKCGSRLKQQYICPKDNEKVEKDDMIKGFEYSKGQYLQFTPQEIKDLDEKGTGSIDVVEFVEQAQIDRIYADKSYFLGPDKGGERAYRLLADALKKTGRVALGQYIARGKQYLISIRPMGNGLVLEQLRYANEIRTIADVPIPNVELKKGELDLAVQVIEQGKTQAFQPEKYEDNRRKKILEQIDRKAAGKEFIEEPEQAPKTQIIDLMEALKASLKGGKAGAGAERKASKPLKRKAASG